MIKARLLSFCHCASRTASYTGYWILELFAGAFYREEDEDDYEAFDEFADDFDDDDDEGEELVHNIVDDEETWMAEDSLWWRPDDAEDFLEADYPSLLAGQLYWS